ncbi:E3 ubiquitin-protein ligase TRIM17-like [Hemiscyllium ocellatum]|uniref:E3 ubiquitin-protein ligase TRIM17-like n=1 Tax=Hemiscyllium ocellatum TaxID=170820 RepID=UPI0029668ADF|nr:E3 ubiquitin-protein ligase TRIM17-like [Hemiscyllium ocellatum]
MASSFKAELTCSVCLDLFQDPVLTRCEHTFCRRCVLEFWSQQQRNMCPLCRKVCPSAQLLRNRVLGGLLDSLRQRENPQLCPDHRLERSLYCPEDQELLCRQCRESPRHRGHNLLTITEARTRYKEEIENTLKLLQDRRKKCEGLKTKSDKYIAKLQDWARQTESQIKNSFRKLHVYLNGEESSLIQQVRQEERESSRKLQDMTKQVFQQLTVLQNNIQEVERHMQDGILDLKVCSFGAL